MSQVADSHILDLNHTLSLLREKAHGYPPTTARNYLKAIAAFEAFTATYPTDFSGFSDEMLADWFVGMVITGHTRKTALQYINSLSAVCSAINSDGHSLEPDEFTSIRGKIRRLDTDLPDCLIKHDSFSRLLQLIRTVDRLPDNLRLTADIMILSLLNPSMSLTDIIRLEKEDIDSLSTVSHDIVIPYISPRRKYLLPLGQSEKTPKQLRDSLDASILQLLHSRNIATFGQVKPTLDSYWAYAAITSGSTPCSTVSALGHIPPGLPALIVCPRSEYPRTMPTAEELLLSNPLQWHAMRLRPGVKFTTLTDRLSLMDTPVPELFYPCIEIARRIGKKLVYRNRPLIADIVFFRSRITDIPQLFRHIGDIAWCYRQSNAKGGTYASIPNASMLEFQTAIGLFTSDMHLYPLGTIDLQPDDIVEVVGDMFAGRQGRVESSLPGDPTIYRLIIWGDNGLEWRADVDSRLIKKITSPQLTVA